MTKVYELPNKANCDETAAHWLAKLDRGLSTEEEGELRAWLNQRQENRTQFLAMARLWDEMNSLSWLAEVCATPTVRRIPRWRAAAAITVGIGAALIAAVYWTHFPSNEDATSPQLSIADLAPDIYETAIGEQSTVRLAEGSEITLNTNSQVQVRLTQHHRLLTLIRGEAHVTVARDPNRPLSLAVKDRIFQALGTAFSVELHANNDIELVVTEGTVLVGSRPRAESTRVPVITPTLPKSSTSVVAGQELRITPRGSTRSAVAPDEIAARLSWREGNLIFRDESLEDALREVSKYTSVQFVFLDDAIRAETIGGRYKAGDIETLLAVLRENVGIAYERTDDNKILLSKQP